MLLHLKENSGKGYARINSGEVGEERGIQNHRPQMTCIRITAYQLQEAGEPPRRYPELRDRFQIINAELESAR